MLAYFDCFSGISGDMTLGALIDLGMPVKGLKDALVSIPLKSFDLSVTSVSRKGISAKNIDVQIKNDPESRNYAEIVSLIEKSHLSDRVKEVSLEIFDTLALAGFSSHILRAHVIVGRKF